MIFKKNKTGKVGNLVRPGWVVLNGRQVSYSQVRVRSRKKMSVLVNQQGIVEVRTPLRVTVSQAEKFLKQCSAWVLQRLQVVEKQIAERPGLVEGAVIPFLGGSLTLRFASDISSGVERLDGILYIPQRWSEDGELLRQRLELWFKRQARNYFRDRLRHWAEIMDVEYGRLTIRSQKTLWGSCSAKNNINLNWRLLWMPHRVADYVVIHELSHLDYMDHSPEFWARVNRFEPDYRAIKGQLRKFKAPW